MKIKSCSKVVEENNSLLENQQFARETGEIFYNHTCVTAYLIEIFAIVCSSSTDVNDARNGLLKIL